MSEQGDVAGAVRRTRQEAALVLPEDEFKLIRQIREAFLARDDEITRLRAERDELAGMVAMLRCQLASKDNSHAG